MNFAQNQRFFWFSERDVLLLFCFSFKISTHYTVLSTSVTCKVACRGLSSFAVATLLRFFFPFGASQLYNFFVVGFDGRKSIFLAYILPYAGARQTTRFKSWTTTDVVLLAAACIRTVRAHARLQYTRMSWWAPVTRCFFFLYVFFVLAPLPLHVAYNNKRTTRSY